MGKNVVKMKEVVVSNFAFYFKAPVVNYFGTKHSKNVLISYIVSPFRKGIDFKHTSFGESLAMAKVFSGLGFNVNIYNYDYSKKIDYSKYDLIFGFGEPLVNYFYSSPKRVKTVYYGTGMHIVHQNKATLARAKEVYKKKGVWLFDSCRIVDKAWSAQTTLVDAMVVLGSKAVADTYKPFFGGKIFSLPLSFYNVLDYKAVPSQKDFSSAKKNFLWFGGVGAVHKGLDILFEVFKKHPDLHLHMCGYFNEEKGFADAFHKELFGTKNIHNYGFVPLKSGKFSDLIKKCGFAVMPSCSEGGSSSVVNCMAYGLVPIAPDTAGLELKNFGIRMKSIALPDVESAILSASKLPVPKLAKMSADCAAFTRGNNSIEGYSKSLKKILQEILKEKA